MAHAAFSDDFKAEPWWWEAAPRPAPEEVALPARVDVLVVGSGYTGLHAAIQTTRGGRDTLVVDAEAIGNGCSTRNGGHVSTSIKPGFDELTRRLGEDAAFAIRKCGLEALQFIGEFVDHEGLDCHFERVGRFLGAHTPRHYETLAQEVEHQPKGLENPGHMVPRTEQRREIGTDLYHGGVVYPRHCTVHAGLYHAGLLALARAAGATVVGGCAVTRIERDGARFRVNTTRGVVSARDVVVATNGYTGAPTPWQRRRVIPIGSYMIATEPLDPALAAEVSPTRRAMSDSRRVVFYYRLAPDRRRMLFGGRVAFSETDPRVSAPRLHAAMTRIFPQLRAVRISHAWAGFVAYTFDTLPHTGVHEGVHYAMGYCGSGVSLASYFGMKVGQKVLGSPAGRTALDGVAFPTRPLYAGDPWFLAPTVAFYRLADALGV